MEVFWRATGHPIEVKDLSLNDRIVLIGAEAASCTLCDFLSIATSRDKDVRKSFVRSGSWLHVTYSVRHEEVGRTSTDPRVAIKSNFGFKWLAFLCKWHLFDYTLHSCLIFAKYCFADSFSDLTTELGSWEVVPKLVTNEENVTSSLIRSVVREHRVHLDLIVVVEVSKIVVNAVDLNSELY